MKKGIKLPVLIIVIGTIIGGILIVLGIYNNINSNYDAMKIKTEDEMKEIVLEKRKAYETILEKRQSEYEKSAYSDEYEKLSRDLATVEGEWLDAEAELYNVQSGKYENTRKEKFLTSVPLIVFGAVVIVVALGLAMRTSAKSKRNSVLTVIEEK